MKNLNLSIEYFSAKTESCFTDTVRHIINQLDFDFGHRRPIRFVFFGIPKNDLEYGNDLSIIKEVVKKKFDKHTPVLSYVAQKPLCNNALVLEAHISDISANQHIHYKSFGHIDYIVVEDANAKTISLGGMVANDKQLSVFDQSMQIFEKIRTILEIEEMPVESIVRQWNYIANITQVVNGKQHYQAFNDARSHFYNTTDWTNGYPAATGIGTCSGGVVVDVFAIKPKKKTIEIHALDNKLQVPAHDYSPNVLIGEQDATYKTCTTPKFERGKVICINPEILIYISGTAAIRGEQNPDGSSIEKQTRTTLENIDYLISTENLKNAGVECTKTPEIKSLRIYLKEDSFYEAAKQMIDQSLPHVPAVYLLGDICRDNLLIEIEGIATNYETKNSFE
jgi:enamine deaminase RidA (YjgF/YER057c/UK114 family)